MLVVLRPENARPSFLQAPNLPPVFSFSASGLGVATGANGGGHGRDGLPALAGDGGWRTGGLVSAE